MAICSHKDVKVKAKEVKIPHLTNVKKKKMEAWGLGGLFAAKWSQAHEDLVKELAGHTDQKVALPKYEYRGKPEAWTLAVWWEVYNLPKASPGGYVMKDFEFSSCAGETGAFSAQPTSVLSLCLVGHYGSYCTYAGLERYGGKDGDETSQGAGHLQ
ncbi:hypothetical protein R1flu_008297 [Riccia fluitans]|uniref:Uncharacterized protein n=1 Tax=Riccia fluitans TaxID=41844 RepID=A0ABD1YEE7_9MARC